MPEQQYTIEALLKRYEGAEDYRRPVFRDVNDRVLMQPIARPFERGDIRNMSGTVILKKEASFEETSDFVKEVMKNGNYDDYLVPFTISTAQPDRMNDMIQVEGWQLANFKQNPGVYYNHSTYDLPIGDAWNTKAEDGRLRSDVRFHGMTELSQKVARLVFLGVMRATSVGFFPIKWQDIELNEQNRKEYGILYPYPNYARIFTKQELYEFSVVTIPANPGAVREKNVGFDIERFTASISKGLISAEGEILNFIEGKAQEGGRLPFINTRKQTATSLTTQREKAMTEEELQALADAVATDVTASVLASLTEAGVDEAAATPIAEAAGSAAADEVVTALTESEEDPAADASADGKGSPAGVNKAGASLSKETRALLAEARKNVRAGDKIIVRLMKTGKQDTDKSAGTKPKATPAGDGKYVDSSRYEADQKETTRMLTQINNSLRSLTTDVKTMKDGIQQQGAKPAPKKVSLANATVGKD